MRQRTAAGIALLLLCITVIAQAQDDCSPVVEQIIADVGEVCADTARNQACYGNVSLEAELTDDSLVFEAAGDTVDLADITALTLDPYDPDVGAWGVALLRAQANLPDTLPGQNVTILLFGDVQLENVSETGGAYYLRTGVGASDCASAPDGIVIQSPPGAEERVSLTINDTDITFGSTLFLTAEEDAEMAVALLEGTADVTADDETQTLDPGTFVTVPLEGVAADGAPTEPEPLPEETTAHLPLALLPDTVPLPDATAEAGASADGVITPRSGTWLLTVGDFSFSAACPTEMVEVINNAGTAPTMEVEVNLEGDIDIGEALATVTEGAGGAVLIDNPEPNVYIIEYPDIPAVAEYTIASETEMNYLFSMDIDGCIISSTVVMEFAE